MPASTCAAKRVQGDAKGGQADTKGAMGCPGDAKGSNGGAKGAAAVRAGWQGQANVVRQPRRMADRKKDTERQLESDQMPPLNPRRILASGMLHPRDDFLLGSGSCH